jgi:Holliday junction DNA helicase RuvA
MIVRLEGILLEKSPASAVVDCNGVGYFANISLTTSEQLPHVGQRAVLHTHLIVRDDAMELVGFATPAERDVFLLLVGIPGVGMRTALSILSAMSVSQLQEAIVANNLPVLQRIPGVGRKTAERLVLELREKIGAIAPARDGEVLPVLNEALRAMVVLGYNRNHAEKALRTAFDQCRAEGITPSVEQLVKLALRLVHNAA